MAKRRQRRKGVGPPPVHNPKRAAREASGEASAPKRPKRRPGEPIPSNFRGVLLRAGIVAAIFYPYLIYVVGEGPGPALVVSLAAFALMVPLGVMLDRLRYRRQMRRYQEKRAGSSNR